MKRKKRYATLLLLAGLLPFYVQAQWSTDPGLNTLVCNAGEDQREPVIITDGNGGVIIAWRDYRYNNSMFGGDILAQRLDADGIAVWAVNGISVNASELGKGYFSPVMVEDGYGGAVIGWGRTPGFFYNYDIFAQKLNSDGARIWAANDVIISDKSGTESFQQIVSDDSCGAILTWTHLPGTPGSTDIYAQRVDSAGSTKWTKNGVQICMAAESQSYPKLTGDGNSGAIITWADSRKGVGESDIYAQKISHDGTVQWTTDGVEVSNYLYYQGAPVIVSDGEGGAIIAWQDVRAGNDDIYAQRINSEGQYMWPEHGIPVCSASQSQESAVIVSDGEGGAIIAWQDMRNGNQDIYAQRVNALGQMQWTTDGVAVTIASDNQASPVAISDNAGGLIITWWDYRTDAFGDIYAQRLNASGTPLWGDNGTAVCTASGYQEFPALASDGDMGAIIVWADRRNGDNYDIYAQKVDKKGIVGGSKDDDLDGINDKEEQGPGSDNPDYDGNSDSKPDWLQANVASFWSYNDQQYITLAVPEPFVIENVQAVDNPAPDAPGSPGSNSCPYGFFNFSIGGLTPGGSTMVTMLLHNGPGINEYLKYGPTPSASAGWYIFDFDGQTGAVIREDTIYLYLTDGLRGDYDITADGRISDPGGPAMITTSIDDNLMPGLAIGNNYPNPFNNQTNIVFEAERTAEIRIDVFDLTGRLVCNVFEEPVVEGRHVISWNATGYQEGVYILKITSGALTVTRKIIKTR
jgi:hypothetical protein